MSPVPHGAGSTALEDLEAPRAGSAKQPEAIDSDVAHLGLSEPVHLLGIDGPRRIDATRKELRSPFFKQHLSMHDHNEAVLQAERHLSVQQGILQWRTQGNLFNAAEVLPVADIGTPSFCYPNHSYWTIYPPVTRPIGPTLTTLSDRTVLLSGEQAVTHIAPNHKRRRFSASPLTPSISTGAAPEDFREPLRARAWRNGALVLRQQRLELWRRELSGEWASSSLSSAPVLSFDRLGAHHVLIVTADRRVSLLEVGYSGRVEWSASISLEASEPVRVRAGALNTFLLGMSDGRVVEVNIAGFFLPTQTSQGAGPRSIIGRNSPVCREVSRDWDQEGALSVLNNGSVMLSSRWDRSRLIVMAGDEMEWRVSSHVQVPDLGSPVRTIWSLGGTLKQRAPTYILQGDKMLFSFSTNPSDDQDSLHNSSQNPVPDQDGTIWGLFMTPKGRIGISYLPEAPSQVARLGGS